MNEHDYRKGTVPCHTWRMIRALEEDQFLKRPAVPGRRPSIVMPDSLLVHKPVEQPAAPFSLQQGNTPGSTKWQLHP